MYWCDNMVTMATNQKRYNSYKNNFQTKNIKYILTLSMQYMQIYEFILSEIVNYNL